MNSNELAPQVAARLKSALPGAISDSYSDGRGLVIRCEPAAIREVLAFLRDDRQCPFDLLANITAVDWSAWSRQDEQPDRPARFSVIYNLYSTSARARLFVEVCVETAAALPSATPVYASANWSEREVFDMFGLRFTGHPDLRRIYLSDDFAGHPLRKDFPRHGRQPQDHPQE